MRSTVLLLLAAASGCASVRTVEPGVVYRGTSFSGAQLQEAVEDQQIRTVINLAGCQPHRAWYQDSFEVCQRAGVRQIDVTLDPRGPDRAELIELFDLYRSAPRPLLLTGRFPGDDVGFAAALFRLAMLNHESQAARQELPWWQSYRWPSERLSTFDRMLVEWRGEADFYRNYQIGRTEPGGLLVRTANIEGPANPAASGLWRNARKEHTEPANDDAASTRTAYAVQAHRKIEVGTVLRDYSAVIIDGPVSHGPLVTGRTTLPFGQRSPRAPASAIKSARLGAPQTAEESSRASSALP